MDVQWYPGHMTKAKRAMQESLKQIDLIIELLDARVPSSSRNPDLDELGKGKARLVVLNKADLADPRYNEAWAASFSDAGWITRVVDSKKSGLKKTMQSAILSAGQAIIQRNKRKGLLNRPIRAMVAGIPNVGKSTFINTLSGRASAKTGNQPGVTKGNQWIRLNQQVEFLDTPGILWPKFEDPTVGTHLAMIGSIRDEVVDPEELAAELIDFLNQTYPGRLSDTYGIEASADPTLDLTGIATARGCMQKGGRPDLARAASLVLDDFRRGKLGRVTLEYPDAL